MTIQAFIIRHLGAEFMTFQAVGQTLQMSVRISQGAWRQLAMNQAKSQQENEGYKYLAEFHNQCFNKAYPKRLVILMPVFSRNPVGTSPPAKIYTKSF